MTDDLKPSDPRYRQINDRTLLVDLDGVTLGTIWRSGRDWYGRRYANSDAEVSAPSRIGAVRALAALPRLYDHSLEIGERIERSAA